MNKLFLLFIIFLSIGCSKDNKGDSPEPETVTPVVDYSDIKLSLLNKEPLSVNENILFALSDKGPNYTFGFLFQFRDKLDSLYWGIEGVMNKIPLTRFNHDDKRISGLTRMWSQAFALPGEYQTYLVGYKDNKIVISDSLQISVRAYKDFLDYNWEDITKTVLESTNSYAPLYKDYIYYTYIHVEKNNTFIKLTGRAGSVVPCKGDCIVDRDKLSWYITTLYGSPKFTASTNFDITDYYKTHFKADLNGAEVLSIWETKKTKMALLKYKYKSSDEDYQYKVLAEENKF